MNAFPILPVLGIVFVTLKLCGVIAWAWLWVLAPFWIAALFCLVFLIIWIVALVFIGLFGRRVLRGW